MGADQRLRYESKVKRRIGPESLKSIIVNSINVVLLVVIFMVVGRLPEVAKEIKSLRGQDIVSREVSDIAVLQAEVEKNRDKINELESVYVDNRGFSNFIKKMDELRVEGVISNITYPSSNPVLNKQGDLGLPMLIEITGTKDELPNKLARVQKLPYILKSVNIDMSRNLEDASVYNLKYGVFLYVDESLKQN